MPFTAILTTVGANKIAAAIAASGTVPLLEMAVGDGNGNPTTPSAGQTGLVRERYRASISQKVIDPSNPNRIIVDVQVPASEGGWTIHEVGVFDNTGALIAVSNFPATYKPLPAEGSARDLTVRMLINVGNTSVVTLAIDPAIVLASQSWVIANFNLAALIPGGTTHQVLRKKTNANGDTEWADATDVNVVVDVITEMQTLAAGQTVVTLSTVTTQGLAVYIEGAREFGWTPSSATELTLDQSYPAGTKAWFVQNDPLNGLSNIELDIPTWIVTGALSILADDVLKNPGRGTLVEVRSKAGPAGIAFASRGIATFDIGISGSVTAGGATASNGSRPLTLSGLAAGQWVTAMPIVQVATPVALVAVVGNNSADGIWKLAVQVPSGMNYATVYLKGGRGADGSYGTAPSAGGNGGRRKVKVPVTPGSTLNLLIGGVAVEKAGAPGRVSDGVGAGGGGGDIGAGNDAGGGGGAFAGVRVQGGAWLAGAGGGGGGGTANFSSSNNDEGMSGGGGAGNANGGTVGYPSNGGAGGANDANLTNVIVAATAGGNATVGYTGGAAGARGGGGGGAAGPGGNEGGGEAHPGPGGTGGVATAAGGTDLGDVDPATEWPWLAEAAGIAYAHGSPYVILAGFSAS